MSTTAENDTGDIAKVDGGMKSKVEDEKELEEKKQEAFMEKVNKPYPYCVLCKDKLNKPSEE